jgi:hypothetical protein
MPAPAMADTRYWVLPNDLLPGTTPAHRLSGRPVCLIGHRAFWFIPAMIFMGIYQVYSMSKDIFPSRDKTKSFVVTAAVSKNVHAKISLRQPTANGCINNCTSIVGSHTLAIDCHKTRSTTTAVALKKGTRLGGGSTGSKGTTNDKK